MHCYLHWVRNGWSCLDLTSLKSVPKLINDFFLSLCRVLAVTTIQTTTKITIYQNEGESVAFYLLINDFSHNLKWAISGILVYFWSLQTVLPNRTFRLAGSERPDQNPRTLTCGKMPLPPNHKQGLPTHFQVSMRDQYRQL